MITITFIVPALRNQGPILVVKDIIGALKKMSRELIVKLYYLDNKKREIEIDCDVRLLEKKYLPEIFDSDIVHTHGIRPDFFVFRNRKKIRGKCITTFHSLFYQEYLSNSNFLKARLIEWVWISLAMKHDKIVCLTNVMKAHYKKYFPSSKLVVINNGRDIKFENIDKGDINLLNNVKSKYKILGTICSLNKRKGLKQVVEALPFLPNYAYLVVGDGDQKKMLEDLANEKKVANRCFFIGSRSNGSRYNELIDIYCFPSYMEGLPLSLIEAAAYAKPIACSDIAIHQEIFGNEVSFFSPNKLESLLEAVMTADRNSDLFSSRVKQRYEKDYTALKMSENYLRLYEELANKKTI